ncbi:MAG: phosphate ABC transporter permease PstA [Acidimicrobiia bacterium]
MSIDSAPTNARPSLHTRSANAAKRKRKDRMMTGLLIFCVTLVLIPIALILYQVVQRGIGAMSWEFLSKVQPFAQRREGGGYLNGLFGTLYLLVIAVTVAVPLGIATATFIVEYKDSKLSPVIRFFTDVMSGVPSIFIGLYIYALLVQGRIGFSIGFSTLAGGLALSLLMLPIVARASEEVLRLVPDDLRNAAFGLGARRWQVVTKTVLPAASSGLITGSMLAVGRAAGETAPLLLTALGAFVVTPALVNSPQSALPLLIYNEARGPFDAAHARAWAGALELMLLVLILTIVARAVNRNHDMEQ